MRLIDADAVKKNLLAECDETGIDYESGPYADLARQLLCAFIDEQPTIDAVPVVRCRDCKHRDAEKGFCEGRGWPMQLVPDDGFCDKGE